MASKMNIPFSPPDITQEEIDEVAEALRSGWITTGPRVKELERQLAEYLGAKAAACALTPKQPVRKWRCVFLAWGRETK